MIFEFKKCGKKSKGTRIAKKLLNIPINFKTPIEMFNF